MNKSIKLCRYDLNTKKITNSVLVKTLHDSMTPHQRISIVVTNPFLSVIVVKFKFNDIQLIENTIHSESLKSLLSDIINALKKKRILRKTFGTELVQYFDSVNRVNRII